MKHYIKLILVCFLLTAIACKKSGINHIAEDFDITGKALLKVYNATLASPTTFVFVDNVKVTGAVVGYTGLFPASTTYAALAPGDKSIKISDTAVVSKINLNVSGKLEAGKYYTIFTYDSLKTAKTKLVNDDIRIPDDTVARLRFANLLYSSTPIPNVDVYSQNLQKNIFSNIPVAEVTAFINHPSKKADTFSLRAFGTTTNLTQLIFTPGQKRSYTIITRGRYQTTTGTIARVLTVMTNY